MRILENRFDRSWPLYQVSWLVLFCPLSSCGTLIDAQRNHLIRAAQLLMLDSPRRPFALLVLAIIPLMVRYIYCDVLCFSVYRRHIHARIFNFNRFQGWAAELEMQMYLGTDESDETIDAKSPGGIVIEALTNIRTVASLTLEEERATEYKKALEKEDLHAIRNSATKGGSLVAS
jgi:hypothetical protein